MGKLRELLPEKRRKDAVLAVEYVMTASPEWWKTASQQQQQAFSSRRESGWPTSTAKRTFCGHRPP